MKQNGIKQGWSSFCEALASGWRRLRERFSGSPSGAKAGLPVAADEWFYPPLSGFGGLGGDVYEDDNRIVVRLDAPGMDKRDLDIQVQGRELLVRGEKRFHRESSEGRYRVVQSAYGGFRRVVPLPAAVLAEKATAEYRDGVLRIELPKSETRAPRKLTVKVD